MCGLQLKVWSDKCRDTTFFTEYITGQASRTCPEIPQPVSIIEFPNSCYIHLQVSGRVKRLLLASMRQVCLMQAGESN